MTASADILTKTKQDVLAVSINSVTTREQGGDNVVSDKKEKPETGLQETTNTGLSADLDEVVFVLQPDKKVKKVKVKNGYTGYQLYRSPKWKVFRT